MKKRNKQIANLLKLGVFLFGISLLLWNCQDETTTFIDIEIAKAHAWFNKNHNPLLEENTFFIGEANWDKVIIINQEVYVPLGNSSPTQINSSNGEIKYIYLYLLFQKEAQGNYIEEFKVFISDKLTNVFEESKNVEEITFSSSNVLLRSSFNSFSINKETNLQERGEDCEIVDWYLVTYVDGKELSREYLYSKVVCEKDSILPEGGGGSSSPEDDQSYDDWNRLTECEKEFFKSNPSTVFSVTENRKKAEEATSRLFPNCGLRNTLADAFRHAYFSALNTKSIGYSNASKLGDAHECETPSSELDEKIMDLKNNSWGYNYSLNHLNLTESQFYKDFISANQNNEIKTLKPCN